MAESRVAAARGGIAGMCILALFAASTAAASGVEASEDVDDPLLHRVVEVDGELTLVFDDGSAAPVGGPVADASPSVSDAVDSHETTRAAIRARSSAWRLAGTVSAAVAGSDHADLHLACTAQLPVGLRIGLTLMPAVDWSLMPELVPHVAEGLIGGVVVLGTPDASVAGMLSALHAAAPAGFLAAVDEEGGRVQRLRGVLGPFPSARLQAAANTSDEVAELLTQHGRDVRALGFDVALAPVLDVGEGPGIGDRAYGATPEAVVEYGLAAVEGLTAAGLVPVVKHFPGHGRASVDSHIELPLTPAIEELDAVDLEPFRRAIDAGVVAIMVGHLDVPGLTDGLPASLSEAAVSGLLRGELGFSGLVMTDALNMGAIADSWTASEAVELALAAGADVMILGDAAELSAVHARVLDALTTGRLAEARLDEAAANVMRASSTHACRAGQVSRRR